MNVFEFAMDRARLAANPYPYRRYMLKYRCIFLHIPKTAGTSILLAFNHGRPIPRDHATWREFHARSPLLFRDYFKFCVVRDPVARYLSAFSYLKAGGNGLANDLAVQRMILQAGHDASSFAAYLADGDNHFRHRVFMPQWFFVCDENMAPVVDTVIRHETVREQFGGIARRFGLREEDLPVTNQSTRLDENLSASALGQLARMYRYDFETFGYALPAGTEPGGPSVDA